MGIRLLSKGFTLLEIVIVVMVIGAIIMVILGLPSSINSVTRSKHASIALEIAAKKIEDLRVSGYANLAGETTSITDPRLAQLTSGTGSVEITDCPAEVCTNSEPVRKVNVKVSWSEAGGPKEVKLETFISEGGL